MERILLGQTDIEVSRLCLGCGRALLGPTSADDERFIATVHHALNRGLNFLDTAPLYGNGHSEELLGQAVAGRRDKVVIAKSSTPVTAGRNESAGRWKRRSSG